MISFESIAQAIINFVEPLLCNYGYLIVFLGPLLEYFFFLGLVITGGSLTALGSFYAAQGCLSLPLVFVLSTFGLLVGAGGTYWIGRLGGWKLLCKLGWEDKVSPYLEYFRERGGGAIFTMNFSSTLGVLVTLIAGVSKMPYSKFLFSILPTSILVNLLFVFSGYFVGYNRALLEERIINIQKVGFLLALISGLSFLTLVVQNKLSKIVRK